MSQYTDKQKQDLIKSLIDALQQNPEKSLFNIADIASKKPIDISKSPILRELAQQRKKEQRPTSISKSPILRELAEQRKKEQRPTESPILRELAEQRKKEQRPTESLTLRELAEQRKKEQPLRKAVDMTENVMRDITNIIGRAVDEFDDDYVTDIKRQTSYRLKKFKLPKSMTLTPIPDMITDQELTNAIKDIIEHSDITQLTDDDIIDKLEEMVDLYWRDLIVDVAKGNTDIDDRDSLHEFLKKRYKIMKDQFGCAPYLTELRDPIITEFEKRINDPEQQFNEDVLGEQMFIHEQAQAAEGIIDPQDLLPDEDDMVSIEYVRFLKSKPHIEKQINKYPALDNYYDALASLFKQAVDAIESVSLDFDVPQFQDQGKQGVGWPHIIKLIRQMFDAAMAAYSQDVDIRDIGKIEELERNFRDAAKL